MLLLLLFLHLFGLTRSDEPNYTPTQHGFEAVGSPRYSNRPLYGDHNGLLVLAGDRPLVRFCDDRILFGGFIVGIVSGTTSSWLQHLPLTRAVFGEGSFSYVIGSEGNISATIKVLPPSNGKGLVVDMNITSPSENAQVELVWAFGCGYSSNGQPPGWALDPLIHPEVLTWDFNPQQCKNNSVTVQSSTQFTVEIDKKARVQGTISSSSANGTIVEANASAWADIPNFGVTPVQSEQPVAVGRVPITQKVQRFVWSFAEIVGPTTTTPTTPEADLSAALLRVQDISSRVIVDSPSQLLNAAARVAAAAIDGLWRRDPPVFVHGAMAWDTPYVGWRSEYGATVYGWAEKVAKEGEYLFNHQIKESNHTSCKSDPSKLLTQEASDSRLYGKGRVHTMDGMYDMQSMMFDQQVHMWRHTGNKTHEAILRPALELHAQWAQECFDADSNGLYHSYINTWPTDSVWFNGGEAVEETSYLYTTHTALSEMAAAAGNQSAAAAHAAVARKIAQNFQQLWIVEEGHPASWREEIGHRRLRPDAWLYSIFLPVQAGLLSEEEAAQALHYTEYALQRDRIRCTQGEEKSKEESTEFSGPASPGGSSDCGQMVWTSNWVPSIWSVRKLWPGDNYGLASAYFLSGLADDGWTVMQGTMTHGMLQTAVPGALGSANGGTDFNDIVHPFARALVNGLFGYRPDYPNGRVTVAPQLPTDLLAFRDFLVANQTDAKNDKSAVRISTPDVSIAFSDDGEVVTLLVNLTTPALLVMELPVHATKITSVTVGQSESSMVATSAASWSVRAGFGRSVVSVTRPTSASFAVSVSYSGLLTHPSNVSLATKPNELVLLEPPHNLRITRYSDPQGVFQPGSAEVDRGAVRGVVSKDLTGYHMVIAYCNTTGGLEQMILYKIQVTLPPPPTPPPSTGKWSFVPIPFNGNVSEIFLGPYLSPRPATCSARIGVDAYSAWTFPYGQGNKPPVPDFANINNLTVSPGVISGPGGAHFAIKSTAIDHKNIAFASMWDNWPTTVVVPVGSSASSVWVLLAGSTNPMQTRLPNAVLRFRYEDNSTDSTELIPPLNFWSLCPYGGSDYSYATDAFCLPLVPPPMIELGLNNRAMVYSHTLPSSQRLVAVELEALSQEVVVGVVAVSILHGSAADQTDTAVF